MVNRIEASSYFGFIVARQIADMLRSCMRMRSLTNNSDDIQNTLFLVQKTQRP